MNTRTSNKHVFFIPPPCWLLLLFIIISWLPYLQILSHDLSFGDEGLIAQSAYRIAQGQVPFKDFFTTIAPGSYYFYALLFKIFEPSFLVLRIGVLLVSLFLLLSIWLILARLGVRSVLSYFLSGTFMAFFGGPVWFIASHHWLSALFCLYSLYFLIPSEEYDTPSPIQALLAGFFSAIAMFMLQHRGGIWFIGSLFPLFFLKPGNRRIIISYYLGGIALFVLPVGLYFINQAGLSTIFYDLITFPMKQYRNFEEHRGVMVSGFMTLVNNWATSWTYRHFPLGTLRLFTWTSGILGLIIVYCTPVLSTISMFQICRKKLFNPYIRSLLVATLLSSYLAIFHRPSDTTLTFATSAAMLIIAVYTDSILTSTSPQKSFFYPAVITMTILFSTIALSYSLLDYCSPKAAFRTPAGTIKVTYEEEALTFKKISAFAALHWKPSEKVFCYPYIPMISFLYRLDNPTAFDTLTWPMHTDAQVKQATDILKTTNCRWIISNTPYKKFSQNIAVENFILNNFSPVSSSPYLIVLEKNK